MGQGLCQELRLCVSQPGLGKETVSGCRGRALEPPHPHPTPCSCSPAARPHPKDSWERGWGRRAGRSCSAPGLEYPWERAPPCIPPAFPASLSVPPHPPRTSPQPGGGTPRHCSPVRGPALGPGPVPRWGGREQNSEKEGRGALCRQASLLGQAWMPLCPLQDGMGASGPQTTITTTMMPQQGSMA